MPDLYITYLKWVIFLVIIPDKLHHIKLVLVNKIINIFYQRTNLAMQTKLIIFLFQKEKCLNVQTSQLKMWMTFGYGLHFHFKTHLDA